MNSLFLRNSLFLKKVRVFRHDVNLKLISLCSYLIVIILLIIVVVVHVMATLRNDFLL